MAVHVKIKVAEAYLDDIEKRWARLNKRTREKLDIKVGDIISVKGRRSNQSAVVVWSARREDEGQDFMRIDGLVRNSVGTRVGDTVRIAKCKPRNAKMVFLSPLIGDGTKLSLKPGIDSRIRRDLNQRPVSRGDSLIVPGLRVEGSLFVFAVREVDPKGIVRITKRTIIDIGPGSDEDSSSDRKQATGTFSFQVYKDENGYFWQMLEGVRALSKSVKKFDTYMECVQEILRVREKIKRHVVK